jgi:hypothetical protein
LRILPSLIAKFLLLIIQNFLIARILFTKYIKCFLHDVLAKSTRDFVNQLDFEIVCMFGLLQNNKSVNFYFVNNILAIRKFCIIKRRNFAIREGKILNIDNYFRSTVLKNVQYAYEYYKSINSLKVK